MGSASPHSAQQWQNTGVLLMPRTWGLCSCSSRVWASFLFPTPCCFLTSSSRVQPQGWRAPVHSGWHLPRVCAICKIPLPEVLWSSSGSGPRHCSHTNKMSSKHFGSTVQKGADSKPGIPSVALGVGDSLPLPPPPPFPLHRELWLIRGRVRGQGPRRPPEAVSADLCAPAATPAPLPTAAGQPFSERGKCVQPSSLLRLSARSPGLPGALIPSRALCSRR